MLLQLRSVVLLPAWHSASWKCLFDLSILILLNYLPNSYVASQLLNLQLDLFVSLLSLILCLDLNS